MTIYKVVIPPPPPTPTVSFGNLPKIPYPDTPTPPKFNFVLETPDGGLPKFATLAKVYFMPKSSSNLLSITNAKDKAKRMGFSKEPSQTTPTILQFAHPKAPATLVLNAITGVFSISYDLKADPTAVQKLPPTADKATSMAKSFLKSADTLPDDLTGPVTNKYIKFDGANLVPALSLSDAKLIEVDLYRKDYDKLPVLSPKTDKANVWFMIDGSEDRENQIIAAEYYYYPVDETKYATYPIKTAQEAWNDLTAGNYYPVDPGENNEGDELKIRRVYLAYFDPNVETQFMQPVVVFEGDRNFKAYVTAITGKYYGQ
jgi:hypothetical protein